jgi:hypothetical protein
LFVLGSHGEQPLLGLKAVPLWTQYAPARGSPACTWGHRPGFDVHSIEEPILARRVACALNHQLGATHVGGVDDPDVLASLISVEGQGVTDDARRASGLIRGQAGGRAHRDLGIDAGVDPDDLAVAMKGDVDPHAPGQMDRVMVTVHAPGGVCHPRIPPSP